MIESIIELLPTVLLNGLYMGLVLTVSQVLFRNFPHYIFLKNKRLVVFIVATLIAIPYNIFYWFTSPEVFTYCVSFDGVKEEICKVLPGWALAAYQAIRLFVCYLATILLYNKIVKGIFERSGLGHTKPKGEREEKTEEFQ
ncbi:MULTISPECIES: hypothetical protein [Leptospira]|uniref:hypothetical protein n=1 Tax=Leptospira TaxID=171 RepID=UPI0002929E8A|nr:MULTISPECIES: hypothetical protein [Leptospira]EKO77717.1 hypothetical protein LEP1GSC068_2945 [Leptospira sp. Fiocruz LV3954]EMI65305.1 hypothetical protein LEP1GSC076_1637 [Leptospira sp. Fiocruz LV4135]MDI7195463.1 hypothetical protein [Leptospira santarosai]MDI7203588.1 hypothetical protein [Leptospira santarosai]OLY61036.1 hypothetical protein BV917_07775 [Leptospira santarosai serovar Guaricura]